MKIKHRPVVTAICAALLGFLLISLGLRVSGLHAHIIRAREPGGSWRDITFPWDFHPAGEARVRITFTHLFLSSAGWQVIPDDNMRKIEINGKNVDLSAYSYAQLSDYVKGFTLDLKPYLRRGTNRILFTFTNGGGPGGLKVIPRYHPAVWFILAFGLFLFIFCFQQLFRLSRTHLVICTLALFPLLSYFSNTPWTARSHDVGGPTGHYGYVKYVAEFNKIPNPNEGWTYYHPPLYYMAGAAVWKWAKLIDAPEGRFLQLLSLIFWLFFLAAGMAGLSLLLRTCPQALLAASVCLAFWPSGIIHSIRIGNDSAYYALCGLCFFLLCRWWKNPGRRGLLAVAVLCALSLLVKSNGILLVAAAGSLILFKLFTGKTKTDFISAFCDGLLVGSISMAGFIASFAVRISYYVKGEVDSWFISNNSSLSSGLLVPKNIKAFIPLDLPTFLASPYMSPWADETGRRNFWNYLFRTSLTGEFDFNHSFANKIALLWGIILIVLLVFAFKNTVKIKERILEPTLQILPWVSFTLFSVVSLIALRISLPYACSNDFRYILPVLPALLAWFALSGKFSRALLYVMAASSSVFFFIV